MRDFASILTVVLSAGLGIAVGAWGGWQVGVRNRENSTAYWIANGAALVIGFGLSFLAAVVSFPPLSFFAIGFMGGSITGLKYGYGYSEGLWRTHDVWMRSDKRMRQQAASDEGEQHEAGDLEQ